MGLPDQFMICEGIRILDAVDIFFPTQRNEFFDNPEVRSLSREINRRSTSYALRLSSLS